MNAMKKNVYRALWCFSVAVVVALLIWRFGPVNEVTDRVRVLNEAPAPSKIAAPAPITSGVLGTQAVASEGSLASGIKPRNFSSEEDLYQLALDASTASSKALQLEGLTAARECVGLLGMQDALRVQIQGVVDKRAEMDLALSTLLKRCKGFAVAGSLATSKLKKSLESLTRDDDASNMTQESTVTPSKILNLLELGSATATQKALISLAIMATSNHTTGGNGSDEDRHKDLFTIAALGAGCELGRDCSANSYESLLQCATSGLCGGNIFNTRDQSMSLADWNIVEGYRRNILSAIGKRDLSSFEGRVK